MKRLMFAVLGAAVFSLFWTSSLYAQGNTSEQETQSQALSVSPAIMEELLQPGQTITKSVVITNLSDVPLPIKASVDDFRVNEALEDTKAADIYRASSWFMLDEPDFILQPKEAKKVTATITAPPKAEPGGHYATIYFQSLVPEEFVQSDRLYLTNRVGVLAFLVVKGNIRESAAVKQFSVPTVRQFGPVEFSLKLSNSGNVHVQPAGKLKVFDWRGRHIDTITLQLGMILPHTSREFTISWDKPGLVGRYTAQAELVYGKGRHALITPRVTLWMVPWLPVIIVLPIAILIIWIVVRAKRRWRKVWRALRGRDVRYRG